MERRQITLFTPGARALSRSRRPCQPTPGTHRSDCRPENARASGTICSSMRTPCCSGSGLRSGGFDKDADVIVMDAIGATGAFNPRNLKEANAQTATLQQLGALHDYRQRRLSGNRWGMAPFEWLVLMIGAACIVGFCWLFGLDNENVHFMMTSAVTIIMSTTMVLLFELQCPFQSDLRIRRMTGTASSVMSSSCRVALKAKCACEHGRRRVNREIRSAGSNSIRRQNPRFVPSAAKE
jgi:hypothetical protein